MKVHVTDLEGNTKEIEGTIGWTLMEVIRDGGVSIKAECGGACACATCHVYVDPAYADKLDEKCEMEDILLEEVCEPADTSRLSCQIIVSDELNGMIVRMPERQV